MTDIPHEAFLRGAHAAHACTCAIEGLQGLPPDKDTADACAQNVLAILQVKQHVCFCFVSFRMSMLHRLYNKFNKANKFTEKPVQ